MSDLGEKLISEVELHSPKGIAALFDSGLDPRAPIRGRTPIQWLTEMYSRSDKFVECLGIMLERGGVLDDPVLQPVLLNDAEGIRKMIQADPALLAHRTTLVSTFTPLVGASLLHVASEYGNLAAARALIELGADVEARAATDASGMNGHTPIFHTVNSNANRSEPILRLLLEAGARTDVHLAGITWGKGFEWETTLFDVTPLSYAQFGLLPQVHRTERDIYHNIKLMLGAAKRIIPPLENIPNRYVVPKAKE